MIIREVISLIIAISVAICVVGGFISIRYFGNDNVFEEVAEKIIEAETGRKIDLSPEPQVVQPQPTQEPVKIEVAA